MPHKNQTNKGQGAARGTTTVSPGMTGRPSEEYATELGAGTAGGAATGTGAARTGRAGAPGARETREFNEFATDLGAGAPGAAGKRGGATTKKEK